MSDKKQAKNPEIRFKQEDGTDYPDWEKQKWGTLTQQVIVRAGKGSSYPVYSVSNSDGFIPQTEQFSDREVASADRSNYKVVAPCQFAYNPSRINVGSIAYLRGTERVIVSPLYIVFACNDGELDEAFLDLYVRTHSFHRQRQANTAGSVRDSLSYDGFAEINLPIPSLDEQQHIASLFAQLDALVSSTQDEVNGLKELKRTLLKKIFDQTIRFTKEDGTEYAEWIEDTIGNIGSFHGGLSGKSKDDFGHGEGRYITYMNVYKNAFAHLDMLEMVDIKPGEKQYRIQYGDIIFTQSSETVEEVGMSSVWLHKDEPYLNSFCMVLRPYDLERIIPQFSGYLMRCTPTRKQIMVEGQGISRINIAGSRLAKVKVKFPSDPEEQARIATLFESLDEAIHEAETELTKYQELKKALMQKMFV